MNLQKILTDGYINIGYTIKDVFPRYIHDSTLEEVNRNQSGTNQSKCPRNKPINGVDLTCPITCRRTDSHVTRESSDDGSGKMPLSDDGYPKDKGLKIFWRSQNCLLYGGLLIAIGRFGSVCILCGLS